MIQQNIMALISNCLVWQLYCLFGDFNAVTAGSWLPPLLFWLFSSWEMFPILDQNWFLFFKRLISLIFKGNISLLEGFASWRKPLSSNSECLLYQPFFLQGDHYKLGHYKICYKSKIHNFSSNQMKLRKINFSWGACIDQVSWYLENFFGFSISSPFSGCPILEWSPCRNLRYFLMIKKDFFIVLNT